jgi:pentatricopeptide repeat protein
MCCVVLVAMCSADPSVAFEVFDEMRSRRLRPTLNAFRVLFAVATHLGDGERIRMVTAHARSAGHEATALEDELDDAEEDDDDDDDGVGDALEAIEDDADDSDDGEFDPDDGARRR